MGGWGQAGNHDYDDVHGAYSLANVIYTSYTGTFHEGRFHSGDSKDDIWTDGNSINNI